MLLKRTPNWRYEITTNKNIPKSKELENLTPKQVLLTMLKCFNG